MIYGIDGWLLIFIGIYGLITILAFTIAVKRFYRFMSKKRKPKLKIIKGGKKEK